MPFQVVRQADSGFDIELAFLHSILKLYRALVPLLHFGMRTDLNFDESVPPNVREGVDEVLALGAN